MSRTDYNNSSDTSIFLGFDGELTLENEDESDNENNTTIINSRATEILLPEMVDNQPVIGEQINEDPNSNESKVSKSGRVIKTPNYLKDYLT